MSWMLHEKETGMIVAFRTMGNDAEITMNEDAALLFLSASHAAEWRDAHHLHKRFVPRRPARWVRSHFIKGTQVNCVRRGHLAGAYADPHVRLGVTGTSPGGICLAPVDGYDGYNVLYEELQAGDFVLHGEEHQYARPTSVSHREVPPGESWGALPPAASPPTERIPCDHEPTIALMRRDADVRIALFNKLERDLVVKDAVILDLRKQVAAHDLLNAQLKVKLDKAKRRA